MKISYCSLGCKVNLYESNAILNQFLENGFELVDFNSYSDVYLINTCTVTKTSDAKSRKMIRKAHKQNDKAIIVVMGCYSQINSQEVSEIEGVSIVCGTTNRTLIYNEVLKLLELNDKQINLVSNIFDVVEYEDLSCNHFSLHTRGFVKIQDGCSNFCSYCAIPFSRGASRSRYYLSIVNEVFNLVENNVLEIVLAGIDTGSYYDSVSGLKLSDLVNTVIKLVPNLGRIRISSIEAVEISEKLIDVISENLGSMCLHLHIPLQGGTDKILNLMDRHYDTSFYKEKIDYIRNKLPLINITTDILVGFDGETDLEFEKAYEFIKSMNYGEMHVFPYSERLNTKAYFNNLKNNNKDRVSEEVKNSRVNRLIELNKVKALEYRELFVNKILDVLVEKVIDNVGYGYSSNYIQISFDCPKELVNKLVQVKLIIASYPECKGELYV